MARTDRAVLFEHIDRLYRGGTGAGLNDAQLLALYVSDRDDEAFETLVRRHGPMVLGLCRRYLRDPRDIEDAFQATFLVLARRAGTIRNRDVLSSWLYGVAHRVATRCRSDVLRRRSVEASADTLEFPAPRESRPCDELGPVLDQELHRLPEKYRAPIVLCYLREQTHDQAAAELNWPVGTVRSRLARGRELLRGRLTRRGWTPAEAMLGLAPGLAPRSFLAPVPQGLVEATVASAGRFLGGTATGLAPVAATLSSNLMGPAPSLARGVLTTMAMTKYAWIGSGLAAIGLAAGSVGAGALAVAPRGDDKPAAKASAAKAQDRPAAAAVNVDLAPNRSVSLSRAESAPVDVSARLAELERKLDLLLRLQSTTPRPSASTALMPATAAPLSPPPAYDRATGLSPMDLPQPVRNDLPPPAAATALPSPAAVSDPPSPRTDVAPAVARTVPAPAATALPSPTAEVTTPSPDLQPASVEPALAEPRPEDLRPARRATTPRARDRAAVPAVDEDDLRPRLRTNGGVLPGADDDRFTPRPRLQTTRPSADQDDVLSVPRVSLREIEARIEIARRKLERNRGLLKAAAISQAEAQVPIDELLLLLAQLKGLADETTEQMDRARVGLARRTADLERSRAQQGLATSIMARNTRLNNNKPGMVSKEEVAKAESEMAVARAEVGVKEADVEEAHLALKQLESRGQRVQSLISHLLERVPELKSSAN